LELQEKAMELGREIRGTSEYQELKRSEENLSGDPAAQEIIQEVQEIQQQIEAAQKMGVQPDQEQMNKFNDLRQKMHENLTVRSFIKAQEDLNELMKTVNDSISEGITGEKPQPEQSEE